jgi:hypothetical protein
MIASVVAKEQFLHSLGRFWNGYAGAAFNDKGGEKQTF